jgi:fibronectin type 3 domain-containing protein
MKYKALIFLLFTTLVSNAQQTPVAVPGKQGIFVWYGHSFAKSFEYQVYINQTGGWKLLAKTKFPVSLSELNARLNESLPLYPYLKAPSETEINLIWEKAKRTELIDSVTPYSGNPLIMEILGTGMLVTGIDEGKDYTFKVVKSYNPSRADTLSLVRNIRFPGQLLKTTFKPFDVKPQGRSIIVEFEITNPDRMFDCEVFRSEYQRNNFEPVSVSKLYYKKNGKSYISISDDGVVRGSGYSYYLIPFDAMGNTGSASEPVNVYNVLADQLSVAFEKYSAKSIEKENAIKLSWRLSKTKDIISIDIFRSESYDGNYHKIMSLSPKDTVYLDRTVKPVSAYFYTIRLNGEYQQSLPSPRIPAILKPDRPNIFPPKNLILSRRGNSVTICWEKFEEDTRGYYIYRADGFKGVPKQISDIVLSDSGKVCYTDTLKKSNDIQTYTYYVADVNTSYAISPMSDPVSVQVVPSILPVPTKVKTSLQNNKVLLVWDDMVKNYPFVIGYRVIRRVNDFKNKQIEPAKTIGLFLADKNFIEDSLVVDNRKYYYTVQCIGLDSTSIGSPSQEVACFIYEDLPPMPSNIKLFPQEKSIIVQWNEPLAEGIDGYKLYRSEKNQEPAEIVTVKVGTSEYIDTNVKQGKSYYYSIETINKKGKRSKRSDYTGINYHQ